MILKAYKRQKAKTTEEKQIEQWFAQYCVANGLYDHMTDKEIETKYKESIR